MQRSPLVAAVLACAREVYLVVLHGVRRSKGSRDVRDRGTLFGCFTDSEHHSHLQGKRYVLLKATSWSAREAGAQKYPEIGRWSMDQVYTLTRKIPEPIRDLKFVLT